MVELAVGGVLAQACLHVVRTQSRALSERRENVCLSGFAKTNDRLSECRWDSPANPHKEFGIGDERLTAAARTSGPLDQSRTNTKDADSEAKTRAALVTLVSVRLTDTKILPT